MSWRKSQGASPLSWLRRDLSVRKHIKVFLLWVDNVVDESSDLFSLGWASLGMARSHLLIHLIVAKGSP